MLSSWPFFAPSLDLKLLAACWHQHAHVQIDLLDLFSLPCAHLPQSKVGHASAV